MRATQFHRSWFSRHATGLALSAGLGSIALSLFLFRLTSTVAEVRRVTAIDDPEPPEHLLFNLLRLVDAMAIAAGAAAALAFVLSPARPVGVKYRRLGAAGLAAAVVAVVGSMALRQCWLPLGGDRMWC